MPVTASISSCAIAQWRLCGSVDHPAHSNKFVAPIWNLKAFDPHVFALPWAVNKRIAACINASMQTAWPRARTENKNVALPRSRKCNLLPRVRLICSDAGHFNPIFAVGPPDQARAVKALLGRRTAGAVFFAHLLQLVVQRLPAAGAAPTPEVGELRQEVANLRTLLDASEKTQQADLDQLRSWMTKVIRNRATTDKQ